MKIVSLKGLNLTEESTVGANCHSIYSVCPWNVHMTKLNVSSEDHVHVCDHFTYSRSFKLNQQSKFSLRNYIFTCGVDFVYVSGYLDF